MVASRRRWIGLFIGTVVPCFTGPGQGRVRDGPSAVLPAGWPGRHVMGAGCRTTIGKDQAACLLVTGKWFGKWLHCLAPARRSLKRVVVAIYSSLPPAWRSTGLPPDQDRAWRSNRLPGDFSRK